MIDQIKFKGRDKLRKRNKRILVFVVLGLFIPVLFMGRGIRHKPSIILLSIDTLRADHLGCYGYSLPTSPSIDRFAADAVLFEYVLSQSPTTAPSHMTIFTGLIPRVHGILDSSVDIYRHRKLSANILTLAQVLGRQGYLTAGFYEPGALWPELGFDRGFGIYDNRDSLWPNIITGKPQRFDLLRQLLRSSKAKKQPLFLFLHHYICHDPYLRAPQEVIDKFLKEKADGLPTGAKNVVTSAGYDADRESFWKNADAHNPAHQRHMTALYDACVNYSDLLFGEIIKILKDEGFYDDSIVILLSDHGEEFGEHGGWRHGRLFIEHLQVPLIIKFPRQSQGGRRITETVRLIDVMPTLFEFLGVKKYRAMQGVSLIPLMRPGIHAEHLPVVSYSCDLQRVWLLEGGFVYCDNGNVKGESLFDYYADFAEKNDLSNAEPLRLREMRLKAKAVIAADEKWRGRWNCGNQERVEPGNDNLKALKALGYLK